VLVSRIPLGTYLLHGEVPAADLDRLENVFLPAGRLYHLDRQWVTYRRVARVVPAQPGTLVSANSRWAELVALTDAGLSVSEVAERVGLAVRTVEGHLYRAMSYGVTGPDTHVTVQFVDPGVPAVTRDRDHACGLTMVGSDTDQPTTLVPGTRLIEDSMPVAEVFALQTNVFLKVDDIDHLGRTWRRLRQTSAFHRDPDGGEDSITAEFADPEVPARRYAPGGSVDVMMAVYPQ
jgi:hypothetical protein